MAEKPQEGDQLIENKAVEKPQEQVPNKEEAVVEVPEQEPEWYKGVPLGGLRGTNFFYKVYMLVVVQYFLSTWGIWLATGDVLSDDFKNAYHNHYCGIIAITLLILLWLGCYFLQYLPKEIQNKEAWWWWVVYGVYIVVFGYSAGYVSVNAVLDVNFLFNLYVLTSFTGVFFYALVCHMLKWYMRVGYMFICAVVFNYVSWTFMHYAHITDAGFGVNLATAGAAGFMVILGIVFTAVVLEDGFRYSEKEFVYCACVFLIETFIIVFSLFVTLYIQPRAPYLKKEAKSNDEQAKPLVEEKPSEVQNASA